MDASGAAVQIKDLHLISFSATLTVTPVEVIDTAKKLCLKDKSGNPPSYVSRRPLKLTLCVDVRESVPFTEEYLVLNKDHVRASLLQE